MKQSIIMHDTGTTMKTSTWACGKTDKIPSVSCDEATGTRRSKALPSQISIADTMLIPLGARPVEHGRRRDPWKIRLINGGQRGLPPWAVFAVSDCETRRCTASSHPHGPSNRSDSPSGDRPQGGREERMGVLRRERGSPSHIPLSVSETVRLLP